MLNFSALGNELQRDAIIAPAFPGRWGSIIKNVALMTAAADAMIFRARINQFVIRARVKNTWDGREKAWPTRAAFVLHLRGEER